MPSSQWSQRQNKAPLSTLDASTIDSEPSQRAPAAEALALTVLHHPLPERLGHQARSEASDVPLAVSRNTPCFTGPGGGAGYPLECTRISRKPFWIQRRGDEVLLRSGGRPRAVRVDGVPLSGEISIPLRRLEADGVLLELGGSVLLWLHTTRTAPTGTIWHNLVGISPKMRALRQRLTQLARLSAPVLIRGASGSGKELVAQALHALSPRASGPWIALNMSAIPVSTAASELFGHGRGAFTGAERGRAGWLEQANGGTLFLDEIGETPAEIQPQLLRVLDNGVIQPVGRPLQRVDVRLLAATDADLEALVREGRFRQALLYRLQSIEVSVPSLHERRVDIPLLLHHFLRGFLRELGAGDLLNTPSPDARPWLGTGLLTRLMRCSFPGNVRQLRSIALAIAAASHDQREAALPAQLAAQLSASPAERPPQAGALSDARVRAALQHNDWVVSRAAEELQVARNTLIAAIRRSPSLRMPRDLSAEDIRAAQQRTGRDLVAAAQALEVSVHGLRLRMRELGIL